MISAGASTGVTGGGIPAPAPRCFAPDLTAFRILDTVQALEESFSFSIGCNCSIYDTCGNTWKVTDLLASQADLAEMVLRPLWTGDAWAHAVFDYPWYYDRLLCVAAACVDG